MTREEAKSIIKAILGSSLPQDKWTKCHVFRCVYNTGVAAGDDKYKCRIGSDCQKCGVLDKTTNPIIVKL